MTKPINTSSPIQRRRRKTRTPHSQRSVTIHHTRHVLVCRSIFTAKMQTRTRELLANVLCVAYFTQDASCNCRLTRTFRLKISVTCLRVFYRASAKPLLLPPPPTPRHAADTTNDITNALQYNGNYAQLWKLFPLFISHTATAAKQQKRARHLSSFVQTRICAFARALMHACTKRAFTPCARRALAARVCGQNTDSANAKFSACGHTTKRASQCVYAVLCVRL